MKPMTVLPVSPHFSCNCGSGELASWKVATSTALGMTVTLPAGIPRATMSARRPSQMVKTWSTCRMAQAAFRSAAVVDGCVFPEGADFVDDRNANPSGDLDCWQGVEHRRVGVDDVRPDVTGDCFQPGFQLLHQGQFAADGQIGQPAGGGRGAVEAQAIHVVDRCNRLSLLGRGQVKGFPTQGLLFAEQCCGAKGIAAVQRDRMIKDVQDARHAASPPS